MFTGMKVNSMENAILWILLVEFWKNMMYSYGLLYDEKKKLIRENRIDDWINKTGNLKK